MTSAEHPAPTVKRPAPEAPPPLPPDRPLFSANPPGEQGRVGRMLRVVRYGLPAAVAIGGLVIMALGSEVDLEGGAGLVSAGLAIYFLNWLFRIGATGDREREAEDAARDYYTKHGRWPD